MPPIFYPPTQPRELIDSAVDCLNMNQKIAMLTLVNIEGNAPYPVGSQMLVNEQGNYWGQITGGCVETALTEQAQLAIKAVQNITERYGRGSQYFDIQLPCGSGIDIHFDTSRSVKDYRAIQSSLKARKAVVQEIEFGDRKLCKTYSPNQRLLIFGQGPILPSLCELACLSGFEVVSFVGQPQAKFGDYCDEFTGLISLFHEHEFEIPILAEAISTDLFYIGAIGSKRTHSARLSGLIEADIDEALAAKIHGPVGLDIGAETPAQIAISILSEVISAMNKAIKSNTDF